MPPVSDRNAQLTIPLRLEGLNRFDNFHVGRNGEVVQRLQSLAGGDVAETGYWLWGEPGRGRSHLLQAVCQAFEGVGRRAAYLPLALLARDPAILEGIHAELVALDDVDAWLGDRALEAELMALYQVQLAEGSHLLLVSAGTAQRTGFALPDLGSRLRALDAFEIQSPDDEGLRAILSAAAGRRGLTLTANVLDYWLHRSVRRLPVLLDQLEQLDARALAEQRRVTIPLVKEALGL
jgi:DnaA family protein